MNDAAICDPPLQPSVLGGYDLELQLPALAKPLDFARIFGRAARLEVEIGSGSGVFSSLYAQAHPGVNLFCIEKDGAEVRRAKDKSRRRGLTNVRFLRCDAHYFLEDYPPPASVDTYHIYFSDPWPKKRHWKRKLFQPRLLPIIERTLRIGGTLLVRTDVTAYYDEITALFAPASFLSRRYDRRIDLEPIDGDIVSNFQRKAIEAGHPIHSMGWERVASSSSA